MKIRMKALASGPAGNYLAGHVYASPHDLSEEQARAFVDGGYAEEIAEKAFGAEQMKTADAPAEPIETAVIEAPKPRRTTKRG
ncbi:hypothetical protein FBQ81_03270 [Chloroflexi bacterium CFX6]|nr:hypothetical protein [Chloroflexi bacterium CFX6]